MQDPLSRLVSEFRALDRRRRSGLSLEDAARYRALFVALSKRLSSQSLAPERREYVRAPGPVVVRIRRGDERSTGTAIDFGGGGLRLLGQPGLRVGDLVRVEEIGIEHRTHRIDVDAFVVWSASASGGAEAGLAFRFDGGDARDRVGEVFYRVLDVCLQGHEEPHTAQPSSEPNGLDD